MYITRQSSLELSTKASKLLSKVDQRNKPQVSLMQNTSCTANARRRLYPPLRARGLVSKAMSAIPT